MEPQSPTRTFTRAEYHRMAEVGLFDDERVELLYGQVVPMSAMGRPHKRSVVGITRLLVLALEGLAEVHPGLPLGVSDDSEPVPDFGVHPFGFDDEEDGPSRAHLLIEISDSSLRLDLGLKAQLYAEAGVPEYWVLDLRHHVLVVHRAPREGRWTEIRELSPEDRVAIAAFPDVAFAVRELLGL